MKSYQKSTTFGSTSSIKRSVTKYSRKQVKGKKTPPPKRKKTNPGRKPKSKRARTGRRKRPSTNQPIVESKGHFSPKLTQMPKRIILIDEHNWASVGTKLAQALRIYFDVRHITLKKRDFPVSKRKSIPASTREEVEAAFNNPQESLIIFIEPGNLSQRRKPFHCFLHKTVLGVRRPDIPFAFFWCGTIYRLTNFILKSRPTKPHILYLTKRRRWLNSRTPLRFCATEDLETIDIGSTFVGQPFVFPKKLANKPKKHKIIHVPTAPKKTNFVKGTAQIVQGFNGLKRTMNTEIVKWGTPNRSVLSKMTGATMYVMTMTSWDSGTGYTGIEALSRGCLVFSKKPKNTKVKSPIINVENDADLIKKVKMYAGDRKLYEKKRREQFEWAKRIFSLQSVGVAIKKDIQRIIKNGWTR